MKGTFLQFSVLQDFSVQVKQICFTFSNAGAVSINPLVNHAYLIIPLNLGDFKVKWASEEFLIAPLREVTSE